MINLCKSCLICIVNFVLGLLGSDLHRVHRQPEFPLRGFGVKPLCISGSCCWWIPGKTNTQSARDLCVAASLHRSRPDRFKSALFYLEAVIVYGGDRWGFMAELLKWFMFAVHPIRHVMLRWCQRLLSSHRQSFSNTYSSYFSKQNSLARAQSGAKDSQAPKVFIALRSNIIQMSVCWNRSLLICLLQFGVQVSQGEAVNAAYQAIYYHDYYSLKESTRTKNAPHLCSKFTVHVFLLEGKNLIRVSSKEWLI